MATLGALSSSYNRNTLFGGSDEHDPYDKAKALGLVLGGSNVYIDGRAIPLTRGVDSDTADLTLTTSWQRVANAEADLRGDLDTGTLHVMGSGWITGSGSVEWGLSADAGTQPVNFFQQAIIPSAYDGIAAFGGLHPDEIPIGSAKVYLWVKASSGTMTLKGSTGDATRWGIGVRAPDSALHGKLSTYGHELILSDDTGTEHGVIGVADGTLLPAGDVFLARAADGVYDSRYGGVVGKLDGLDIYGQTFDVKSSAFKLSGIIRPAGGGEMLVDPQGVVYIREEGTSQSQTDTSTSTQAVTLTHDLITGLSMTLTDNYTAGEARAYLSVSFVNGNTRTGDFFAAVRVNTVEGTAQSFPVDAIGAGALTVDLPVTETLVIGDVIDVVCWRTDDQQVMTLALQGDVNAHTLSVYEQSQGGGTGEANTLGDVGSGVGISAGKAGTVLQAKSFTSTGATVAITSNGTEVNFESLTGGSGDMTKAVYDPTSVNSDAFARSNHTGTQALATISDAGGAAALDVGTTAGTVAAGDDSRIVNAASQTDLSNHKAGTDEHSIAGVTGLQSALDAKSDTDENVKASAADTTPGDLAAKLAFNEGLEGVLTNPGGDESITIGCLPAVIRSDVLDQFDTLLTEKATPVAGDRLLLEDSAAAGAKKWVAWGSLPSTAPTTREITQSGALTVTVADNELITITVDTAALLTIEAAAGSVVSQVRLSVGTANIAFTGTDVSSWPLSGAPDLDTVNPWLLGYVKNGTTSQIDIDASERG